MNQEARYIRVAVSGPLRQSFTYRLPDDLPMPQPGRRLVVPFGKRTRIGYFLGQEEKPKAFKTKMVVRLLDSDSLFPRDLFELCTWMADYYFANPADCFSAALPASLKAGRSARIYWGAKSSHLDLSLFDRPPSPGRSIGKTELKRLQAAGNRSIGELIRDGVIVEQWLSANDHERQIISGYRMTDSASLDQFFNGRRRQLDRFEGTQSKSEMETLGWSRHYIHEGISAGVIQPVLVPAGDNVLSFVEPRADVSTLVPTPEQQFAIDRVSAHLTTGFKPFLMHGVAGSGKTLVYCQLIRRVLDQGRTALLLTPEISLSGITLAYLRGFFGQQVTVLHSAMTAAERLASWQAVRQGRFPIVVGPRSAVFAPLHNLGLIIVDEEHDESYKQDDPAPRFHGRDCSIMRAQINDIPVLLGSASPSFESYHNALSSRYELLELTQRPAGAIMPKVRTIDMRKDRLHGDLPYMSYALKKKVESCLTSNEQVILYLNRRGYSPQLKCTDCGFVPACPHCATKLTYHRSGEKLTCHSCGMFRKAKDCCEHCGGHDLWYPGVGTQKIETNLPRLFAQAKTVRFDSDSASGRSSSHRILKDFADGKHNLLLGTQMVTKGLDLPRVTLVGVISADLGLDMPDFRASERTFARLLQVAGRAGRADLPGNVLIQTYYPDHSVIQYAADQNFRAFYDSEIISRDAHRYPPFVRLVNIVLLSKDEKKLEGTALSFVADLRSRCKERLVIDLLGPSPCPLYRVRGRYRRQILIKTARIVRFGQILTEWEGKESRFGLPASTVINVDVDPCDMM